MCLLFGFNFYFMCRSEESYNPCVPLMILIRMERLKWWMVGEIHVSVFLPVSMWWVGVGEGRGIYAVLCHPAILASGERRGLGCL